MELDETGTYSQTLVCAKNINVLLILSIEISPRKLVQSHHVLSSVINTALGCVCHTRQDKTQQMRKEWTNFLWLFSIMRMMRAFTSFEITKIKQSGQAFYGYFQ